MKLKLTILLVLLLTVGISRSFGQFIITLDKNQEIKTVVNIPGMVADPNDTDFSGAVFAKAYPKLKIPSDKIVLHFPEIKRAVDTIAVLWYLVPEENSFEGELNVILIAITPENAKHYYIDNNNDRTFSSNETNFIFKSSEQKRFIDIEIRGGTYRYTLFNPDYIPPPPPAEFFGSNNIAWSSARKKLSLSIDFSTSFGGGKTSLSYSPVSGPVSLYRYNAIIPGTFRPGIGLDISWYGFHVCMSGGYEYTQYTSTTLRAESTVNSYTVYNKGLWPKSKLNFTLAAEYDIGIGKYLYLSPYGNYTVSRILSKDNFDKSLEPVSDASYDDANSTEYGLKMKLPLSTSSMLYLKMGYSKIYFNATDYLLESKPDTYDLDQHLIYYGVGILMRLTGNHK